MEAGERGGGQNVLQSMIGEHFPSGPGVKNLPFDAGNVGSILGQGTTPCLFNFYAEYIMRNAELEEAQAGIKIAWRNINNLICR